MKFNEIFRKTIELWPISINISDGRHIKETNGFYFQTLSRAWNNAEDKASNEWQQLMIWIIYQVLHRKAINFFKVGTVELIVSRDINPSEIENLYFESLKGEGYEEMLKEYSR